MIKRLIYKIKTHLAFNWTLHKDMDCEPKQNSLKLSKIQNNALENELNDCKAECNLKHGCIAFIFKPSTVCVNLAFVDLKKCKERKGYNVFFNGRLKDYYPLIYMLPFLLLYCLECLNDPIAINKLLNCLQL